MNDFDRFWCKVAVIDDEDSCWLWMAGRFPAGYGAFTVNGKTRYAHRVAWEMQHGPIPKGICILHRCDVPACVRHLFSGTKAENNADKAAKGRAPHGLDVWQYRLPDRIARGDRNGSRVHKERMPRGASHATRRTTGPRGNARILPDQAIEIRERYRAGGITQRELGRKYGIGQQAVQRITSGKNWKQLPEVAS